jgi:hypothetical protein
LSTIQRAELPPPSALTLRPAINYARERHRFGINSRAGPEVLAYGAWYWLRGYVGAGIALLGVSRRVGW